MSLTSLQKQAMRRYREGWKVRWIGHYEWYRVAGEQFETEPIGADAARTIESLRQRFMLISLPAPAGMIGAAIYILSSDGQDYLRKDAQKPLDSEA